LATVDIVSADTNINGMDTFDNCKNLTIRTVPGGKAWKYAEDNNIKRCDITENR